MSGESVGEGSPAQDPSSSVSDAQSQVKSSQVTPRHVTSRHVMSSQVQPSHNTPRQATSSQVPSRRAMSNQRVTCSRVSDAMLSERRVTTMSVAWSTSVVSASRPVCGVKFDPRCEDSVPGSWASSYRSVCAATRQYMWAVQPPRITGSRARPRPAGQENLTPLTD